jgi:hypothetical protein
MAGHLLLLSPPTIVKSGHNAVQTRNIEIPNDRNPEMDRFRELKDRSLPNGVVKGIVPGYPERAVG